MGVDDGACEEDGRRRKDDADGLGFDDVEEFAFENGRGCIAMADHASSPEEFAGGQRRMPGQSDRDPPLIGDGVGSYAQ
jgi:hypothetical protein